MSVGPLYLRFYILPDILSIFFSFCILSGYWFTSMLTVMLRRDHLFYNDIILLPAFAILVFITEFYGKRYCKKAIVVGLLFIIFSFASSQLANLLPSLKHAGSVNVAYEYFVQHQASVTPGFICAFIVSGLFIVTLLPQLKKWTSGNYLIICMIASCVIACLLFNGVLYYLLQTGVSL